MLTHICPLRDPNLPDRDILIALGMTNPTETVGGLMKETQARVLDGTEIRSKKEGGSQDLPHVDKSQLGKLPLLRLPDPTEAFSFLVLFTTGGTFILQAHTALHERLQTLQQPL